MANVLNAVFGIAIGVVIFLTVILGIKTFFPEPSYDNFCSNEINEFDRYPVPKALNPPECDCNNTETAEEIAEREKLNEERQECQASWDTARDDYNKIPFFITVIVGAGLLILSYFIFSSTNIASGAGMAGVVLVIYGFARGWESTDDRVKFIMMILLAAVVLFLAIKLNKKFKH